MPSSARSTSASNRSSSMSIGIRSFSPVYGDEVPASRRRRVQTWVGVGFLLAGLSLIGWYCWQTYGTTWQSHAEARPRSCGQLEDGWGEGSVTVETEFGYALAIIRIPRFGKDNAVPLLEGTSDEVLAAGYGHLEGTSGPGEPGNFVIAGHRVTHGEPLRDMPDLAVGDEVVVETADAVYTYVLTTGWRRPRGAVHRVVGARPDGPMNPDADGVGPSDAPAILTLTTCSELFHTDDRLVAFASLTETAPK